MNCLTNKIISQIIIQVIVLLAWFKKNSTMKIVLVIFIFAIYFAQVYTFHSQSVDKSVTNIKSTAKALSTTLGHSETVNKQDLVNDGVKKLDKKVSPDPIEEDLRAKQSKISDKKDKNFNFASVDKKFRRVSRLLSRDPQYKTQSTWEEWLKPSGKYTRL